MEELKSLSLNWNITVLSQISVFELFCNILNEILFMAVLTPMLGVKISQKNSQALKSYQNGCSQ